MASKMSTLTLVVLLSALLAVLVATPTKSAPAPTPTAAPNVTSCPIFGFVVLPTPACCQALRQPPVNQTATALCSAVRAANPFTNGFVTPVVRGAYASCLIPLSLGFVCPAA